MYKIDNIYNILFNFNKLKIYKCFYIDRKKESNFC